MKKPLITCVVTAATALLSNTLHAQSIYGGVGVLGLYNIGYAHSLGSSFSVRAQYGGGLDKTADDTIEGVQARANIKYATTGLFADWHPFSGGFRVATGISFNDVKAQVNALGSGTATINGKTVNMSGETYNVALEYPKTTPYLGIGYGHNPSSRGLGFYVDFGVLVGKFKVRSETSLVGSQGITQADIDAQDAKMRDSVGEYSVLPVVHLGMSYRF